MSDRISNVGGLTLKIRREIERQLSVSEVRIDTIARSAGVSTRTLQRHLRKDGETFSKIVEEIRRDSAFRLLRERKYDLSVVAKRLGYSDSAHFSRAFRRWTGGTPSQYRRNPG